MILWVLHSYFIGRAMVDVILQAVECDAPKLKDCLPAIGALKHLREWHSAQITIAASDAKGYGIYFRSTTSHLCFVLAQISGLK